ncbi:MAG: Unknown protein [uncultured Aureispira sp.]|uniref:Uncharacterized protein n=1 Tax=uncultured Aureispira sp. TaxID=1331704 RepID=A0A6S6SME5_9BACT|nr:MAG: Unknown protein [uncultured Aureispira sp.]
MEQTYGFWGFILYFLSFLGCGGGTYNDAVYDAPPVIETEVEAETPAYKVDYQHSLKQWHQEKEQHKNAYTYTLFFENRKATYRSSKTVVVKNGLVYSCKKITYAKNFQTGKMDRLKKETWKENQKQLGTHGEFTKTLEELYEDCNHLLLVDSKLNSIVFTMDDNQLLSTCGFRPVDCAGDCFTGITLQDFKWLN